MWSAVIRAGDDPREVLETALAEREKRRKLGPTPRKTQDDLLKASFDETSARATLELFSRAYHESRDMTGLGWLIGSFFRRWPDLKDDFPWFERYQD